MTQPKHIIFDLDGTLIHSAPDIHAAINDALMGVGRPTLSLDEVISFIGNGVETLVRRSLRATGGGDATLVADTLARFLESYNNDPSSRTVPYPDVLTCLERLQNTGRKLAICTNKPDETAQDICDALDITRYFDVIAGARADIPKKPDPTPLLRVMETLSAIPANTVYVGDSTVDQDTARNAGVPFVLFAGGYLNAELGSPAPVLTFENWNADWISELGHRN